MLGFYQIPLDPDSRKFTAFSTKNGHYQFTRLPFGLNTSPNSFQRMMNISMAGLTPELAFIYIDDIIVISCSLEHHLSNLKQVFERLRHYNLKVNAQKCKFFNTEVTYLGHKITDRGLLPDDSKFNAILNYPVPNNSDGVRRFVAFCNYYRKLVPNFANLAHPLNQLLKKKQQFIWTAQCQEAFEKLKQFLISRQLLQYPDFSKTFILTTDDLPIAYASKTFTPGEKNKAVILKELTAIHWAISYFKSYLYGKFFLVRTDRLCFCLASRIQHPNSHECVSILASLILKYSTSKEETT